MDDLEGLSEIYIWIREIDSLNSPHGSVFLVWVLVLCFGILKTIFLWLTTCGLISQDSPKVTMAANSTEMLHEISIYSTRVLH